MSNNELFEDGPRLLRCEGCGRYFEEPLLKRCRVCGKLFCAECRETHDCREPIPARSADAAAPPIIIHGLDEALGATELKKETSEANAQQRKYAPLTFIDDEKSSIGSADVRRNDEPKTYGSYQIPIPVPEAPGQQTAEVQQPTQQEQHVSPVNSASKQQAPVVEQTTICDVQETESTSVCGPDELICDDCGRVWKKSDLRRCKKCGAVLCPNCREKHKCNKTGKKPSTQPSPAAVPSEVKPADVAPQVQQSSSANPVSPTDDRNVVVNATVNTSNSRKLPITSKGTVVTGTKSVGLSIFLGILLVGAGYMYAGKVGKGILALICSLVFCWTFAVPLILWIVCIVKGAKLCKENNLLWMDYIR